MDFVDANTIYVPTQINFLLFCNQPGKSLAKYEVLNFFLPHAIICIILTDYLLLMQRDSNTQGNMIY